MPFALLARQQPARDVPAQAVAGTSAIAGVVLTADRTPQPARKARVTLNSVDRSVPGRTETTDDGGRFVFRNVPAGRFTLAAGKPGYLTANYGAKRPDRAGTPVTIADGQQLANVVMTMARGSVITGIVRDQGGQPAPGIDVSVLRFSFFTLTGEKRLAQESAGGSGVTDDRGVYRAWGLPPGDYIVVVAPGASGRAGPPGANEFRRISPGEVQAALQFASPGRGATALSPQAASQTPRPPAGAPISYAPIFYPGTADLAAATTLTLGVGEERGGIDVTMSIVPTARIEGVLGNVPAGVQVRTMPVTLTPSGAPGQMLAGSAASRAISVPPNADGTFRLIGVTPGQYTLLAKTGAFGGRGGPPRGGGAPGPVFWAMSEVTIDGRDVSVTLDVQPGMTIAGHLGFDGASPPPSLAGMRFFLVPPGSGGNLSAGPQGGDVDAEGKLNFTGVTPGMYRLIRVGGSAGPWALKSATADGRDILDAPLEITPNGSVKDLAITFTDTPTQLLGVLQDTSGRPASDYFIIIFPTEKSYWTPGSRRVVSTRPANDGHYVVGGLPPGDYRVAALTDVESGEWNDPGFLAKLVDASIKVTLVEGQKTTQDLKLAGGG